jgi:uncharacterized protein YunC (DUF1805 family)
MLMQATPNDDDALPARKWMTIMNDATTWDGIDRLQLSLAAPLLIARGRRGMLTCGYINPATCDKTGEACAIVTGVKSFDDMLTANVVAVSQAAAALGIAIGITGREALEKMR